MCLMNTKSRLSGKGLDFIAFSSCFRVQKAMFLAGKFVPSQTVLNGLAERVLVARPQVQSKVLKEQRIKAMS